MKRLFYIFFLDFSFEVFFYFGYKRKNRGGGEDTKTGKQIAFLYSNDIITGPSVDRDIPNTLSEICPLYKQTE